MLRETKQGYKNRTGQRDKDIFKLFLSERDQSSVSKNCDRRLTVLLFSEPSLNLLWKELQ